MRCGDSREGLMQLITNVYALRRLSRGADAAY